MKKLLILLYLINVKYNSHAIQIDGNGNLVTTMPQIISNHIPYEEPSLGPSPYPTTTGGQIMPALGETIRTPGGYLETAVVAVPNFLF